MSVTIAKMDSVEDSKVSHVQPGTAMLAFVRECLRFRAYSTITTEGMFIAFQNFLQEKRLDLKRKTPYNKEDFVSHLNLLLNSPKRNERTFTHIPILDRLLWYVKSTAQFEHLEFVNAKWNEQWMCDKSDEWAEELIIYKYTPNKVAMICAVPKGSEGTVIYMTEPVKVDRNPVIHISDLDHAAPKLLKVTAPTTPVTTSSVSNTNNLLSSATDTSSGKTRRTGSVSVGNSAYSAKVAADDFVVISQHMRNMMNDKENWPKDSEIQVQDAIVRDGKTSLSNG
jgi:hypothetical protein